MRGSRPASIVIWRISSVPRPSGRFFWIAMRSRMIDFSSLSNASCALPRASAYSGASSGPEYWVRISASTALVASWRASLSSTDVASSSFDPCEPLICSSRSASTCRRLDLELRRLAGLLAELLHGGDQLLDLRVRDVERVEDLRLGDLVGAGLDHQDGLGGAGDHEVEVSREEVLLVRVDDEVAVDLADPDRADRLREGDVGDHQRRGGAVHGEDVVRDDMVDRQRDRDELRLAVPALGEERAQRAVDHAGDEGALLAGAALALEEASGDLARGVHALLDIHRQREEVDVTRVAGGCGAQHHRLASANDHGSGSLLGKAPRLERDLGSADFDGNTMHFRHMFLSRPRFGTRVPLHLVDASVLLRTMVVATDTLAP